MLHPGMVSLGDSTGPCGGLTIILNMQGNPITISLDLLLEAPNDRRKRLLPKHASVAKGKGEAYGLRELLGANEPNQKSVGGILHPCLECTAALFEVCGPHQAVWLLVGGKHAVHNVSHVLPTCLVKLELAYTVTK